MKLFETIKLLFWKHFRPSKYYMYLCRDFADYFTVGLNAAMTPLDSEQEPEPESEPEPELKSTDITKLVRGLGEDKPVLLRFLAILKAMKERPEWVAVLRRTKKRRIAKKYRTKIWKYYMEGLTDVYRN